jgi:hypothetical protein
MTSHPTKDVPYAPGPWITSVVLHDDGPATYAVHKRETAPDLVADYIQHKKTAILIAAAPDLLDALEFCVERLEINNIDATEAEAIDCARGAIVKAKGE